MKQYGFRHRILMLAVALVFTTQLVVLFPVLDLIKRDSDEQADRTVGLAGALFDEYMRNRDEGHERTVGVVVSERAPQPGGLDEQLGADLALEVLVVGGVEVADDGVGDGGVDVERGRAGGPVARRLPAPQRPPWERCALEPQLAGPVEGDRQRQLAPAQRVGRRRRLGVHERRQHEDLGVPEGVAVVAGAGQALGGDGPLLGPRRRSA